mgnify:CR=1 FL=1
MHFERMTTMKTKTLILFGAIGTGIYALYRLLTQPASAEPLQPLAKKSLLNDMVFPDDNVTMPVFNAHPMNVPPAPKIITPLVPHIPAQLQADYSDWFAADIPSGTESPWAEGRLIRMTHDSAMYVGPPPENVRFVVTATSDLNAIAREHPNIAAWWFERYGFVPV